MDKESMAMLQNKRQEFRCNQVVKAVNKERDLRERELSYESNQIKGRLQKLIDKRKELNLDPLKTRELEMLMGPGLKMKSCGPSPERKISPAMLPGLRVTDDAGNNIFVTNLSCLPKHIVEDNSVVVDVPQDSINTATDSNNNCQGTIIHEGQGHEKPIKNDDIMPGRITRATDEDVSTSDALLCSIRHSSKQQARKISQGSGRGIELQPLYEDTNHLSTLSKSASDLHAKLGNVQQWLSDLEIETNRNERRLKQRTKRHSASS